MQRNLFKDYPPYKRLKLNRQYPVAIEMELKVLR